MQPERGGLAAGHGVVELAREGRLVVGAAWHPDVQPVALADEARHVRPVGTHAEPRHGGAFEQQQRRARELPGDGIGLLSPQPAEASLGAQFQGEGAHRVGALLRRVERSIEMPGGIAVTEQVGLGRERGREVAVDVAGALGADEPRLELAEVGVVATCDMVEEGHAVEIARKPHRVISCGPRARSGS